MNKRRCGTCRFYQEARLASSGWCHHPQRKVTSDLMIMVRKNELACRDEWAHDLWEPAEPGGDVFRGRDASGRMAPATEQEIAALLRAEAPAAATGGAGPEQEPADVVLSELGLPEPPDLGTRPAPVRPEVRAEAIPASAPLPESRVSDPGARTAIIKAREAYRERQRLAARAAEAGRLAEAVSPPVQEASADPGSSPSVQAPASDVDRPESARTQPIALESAADDATQNSEPAQGELTEPTAHDDDQAAAATLTDLAAATDKSAERLGGGDDRITLPPLPDWLPADDTVSLAQSRREPAAAPAANQSLPAAEGAGPAAVETWPDTDGPREPPRAATQGQPVDATTRQPQELAWIDDIAYDNVAFEDTPEQVEALETFAERADSSDENFDVVASDDDLLRSSSSIAAHLERACRNCRDFRPAETGERGWCANRWAFSHRRMVDADERAPCETSLGDWWLPVDEVWSHAADVSGHGQPTPLVDAWLSPRPERAPTRRRS